MIVSFCNQTGKNLYVLEEDRYLVKDESITGITQSPTHIYAITQVTPRLLTIDKENGDVEEELVEIGDPHSIVWAKGKLYAVSSEDGAVYTLPKKLFWKTNRTPYQHINSIAYHKNNFYVSSLYGGYIQNITTGKIEYKCQHPHSLRAVNGDLWWLSSGEGRLYKNGKVEYETDCGYLRGLSIEDGEAFIGVSRWRDVSRSGRTRKEIRRKGDFCGVLQVEKGKLINIFPLNKHSEIFALCPNKTA